MSVDYSTFRITEDIPNTMAKSALYFLAALARSLGDDARIVEAGALYGCTAWVLSKNAPGSTIYSIDPWEHLGWMDGVKQRYPDAPPISLEAFKRFTADCTNVTAVQGYAPAASPLDRDIDLFFEDATHKAPVVGDNLRYFSAALKPGGILCGDDYGLNFPDVIEAVAKIRKRWNSPLIVRDRVWALTKPTENGGATIFERLRSVLGTDVKVSCRLSDGRRVEGGYFAWTEGLWQNVDVREISLSLDGIDGVGIKWQFAGEDGKGRALASGHSMLMRRLAHVGSFRATLTGPRADQYQLKYQAMFIHPESGEITYSRVQDAGKPLKPRQPNALLHNLRITIHGAIVPERNLMASPGAEAAVATD